MKRAFSAAAYENPISTNYFATSALTYDVIGVPFGASSAALSSAAINYAASSASSFSWSS